MSTTLPSSTKGRSFFHYFPDSAILTSAEFAFHADIYKDLDAVETAFKRLVQNLVPRRGYAFVAFDGVAGNASEGASLERCLSKAFCPWWSDMDQGSNLGLADYESASGIGSYFAVVGISRRPSVE